MWCFNRFALLRAGAKSIRLQPGHAFDVGGLDGLVLGGGDDVDADLYGGEIRPRIRIDPQRDALELDLLRRAAAVDLPVLGICRGSQMINVARGGTLHRDIHEAFEEAPRVSTALPRKTIHIIAGTRLHDIIGKDTDRVNALHRQAVDALGRDIAIMARDEHEMIQAIECQAHGFLLGVQWHPEFMIFDVGQQKLYRTLVDAARDYAWHGRQAAEDRRRAGSRSATS